ncbi:MAG: adaptor protein MecA [Clostridia bacterium]|nr:adaptor protein MecA [Clostridia bacterium]NCD01539.1 adaptor protein MecA [Clostridia bacterium]
MKIEKLNENQIRCTLNKEDLAGREIKLSELAYGSDKAKRLFRDMMTQASTEVGFEANDIPLVIEAIPVSSECIILIVTKVEDPEELDTRFSKFSAANNMSYEDEDGTIGGDSSQTEYRSAADILDLFKKISEELIVNEISSDESQIPLPSGSKDKAENMIASVDMTKIFLFHRLEDVCQYAKIIQPKYNGWNTLYKDPVSGSFYLTISKGKASPELYNKICNIAIEYGECVSATAASVAYYNEHFTVMIRNKAIQKLAIL